MALLTSNYYCVSEVLVEIHTLIALHVHMDGVILDVGVESKSDASISDKHNRRMAIYIYIYLLYDRAYGTDWWRVIH
ncbi:hypothetical protein ABKN59_007130 [Abortiporus biennis]